MVRSQKSLRGTWLVSGGLLYAAFVAAARILDLFTNRPRP